MATKGNTNPTLFDVASRLDPQGGIQTIAEILNETNEILDDATFMECNDGTSHKTTIRSGLPQGTWRKLNYGVQPSKSTTVQIKDSTGMLENYSVVDKALADLNGNTSAFRLSEDKAFIEGMNQQFAETLIYGDSSKNPERFMGLAPRFNSLSAENASNIINAGGTGADCTSIWLVVWAPDLVHCLYPKGSKAGIHHQDKGQDTVRDAAGREFEAYRTHYKLDVGLTVRDWRYVVRIANIKTSTLTKDASSGADLIDLMDQALELIPNLNRGRACFYMNRTIRGFVKRQAKNHPSAHLSKEEIMRNGMASKTLTFDEVPMKRVDAILNNESAIS